MQGILKKKLIVLAVVERESGVVQRSPSLARTDVDGLLPTLKHTNYFVGGQLICRHIYFSETPPLPFSFC